MTSKRLFSLVKNRHIQNATCLYGVQFANVIFPLISVPYLARVLRPDGFGRMTLAQGIATYLTILIGYGFNASATREVARHKNSLSDLSNIVAGVFGAKILLSLVAIVAAFIITLVVQSISSDFRLLTCALTWGIFYGFSFIWYFQGIGDLRLVSIVDISVKFFGTLLTIVLVHAPSDAWKVLALLALSQLIVNLVMILRIYRRVPYVTPTWISARNAMKSGWHMFYFNVLQDSSASTATVILGFMAAPAAVACYTSADRILRIARMSLGPMLQLYFPHIAYEVKVDPRKAAQLAIRSTALLAVLSSMVGIAIWCLAPLLIPLLLGKGYQEAIPVIRILAPLPLLIVISQMIGNNWAHPLGLDREMSSAILISSITFIIFCFIGARLGGASGIAWVALGSQALTVVLYIRLLARKSLLPTTVAARPAINLSVQAQPLKPVDVGHKSDDTLPGDSPAATIVIPTKNRSALLMNCVRQCYSQSVPVEVVIVDDGSTDETSTLIAREFPKAIYIRLPGGCGPAKGRNIGIKAARTEICFPIDDDLVFGSDRIVESILRDFDDERFWAVTIPFINVNKANELRQSLNPSQLSSGDQFIAYAYVGCAHALRRSVFLGLGGYREKMFYMGEESDICIRALSQGYFVKVGRSDPCLHFESPSRKSTLAAYWGRRNEIRFVFWYAPLSLLFKQLPVRIIAAIRTSLFHAAPGTMVSHIKGTALGICDCLTTFEDRSPVTKAVFETFWRLRSSELERL